MTNYEKYLSLLGDVIDKALEADKYANILTKNSYRITLKVLNTKEISICNQETGHSVALNFEQVKVLYDWLSAHIIKPNGSW